MSNNLPTYGYGQTEINLISGISNVKNIYLIDILNNVVNSMKSSAVITNIIDKGDDIYTISTNDTGNLQNDFKIKIDLEYYRIFNLIENKSFDVTSKTDITGLINQNWLIYFNFLYGHRKEIANIINRKNNYKEKFDLIWLYLDFKENLSFHKTSPIYSEIDFYMAFVTNTNESYLAKDRFDNRFKTRLQDIFSLFNYKLNNSKELIINFDESINIEKVDRYIFGSIDGKNILNEKTDAIEINISDLKIKKQFINQC